MINDKWQRVIKRQTTRNEKKVDKEGEKNSLSHYSSIEETVC